MIREQTIEYKIVSLIGLTQMLSLLVKRIQRRIL